MGSLFERKGVERIRVKKQLEDKGSQFPAVCIFPLRAGSKMTNQENSQYVKACANGYDSAFGRSAFEVQGISEAVLQRGFFAACRNGQLRVVKFLAARINVKAFNARGKSGLALAIENNQLKVVQFLLEDLREEIDSTKAVTKSGMKMVHFACIRNAKVDMVAYLMRYKTFLNERFQSLRKETCLTIVANNPVILRVLLQNRADVNIRNGKGNTALHMAARKANFESVKLLLLFGASLSVTNNKQQIPVDVTEDDSLAAFLSTYPQRLKKCRESVVTIMCIRKYKQRESCLGMLNKDVMHLLARAIWKTRLDE